MREIIKKLICTICIAVLFIACKEGLEYILVDDTSSYTRLTMHQLYHSDENIDIAFVGSSHVYRSLVPSITDEGFGASTFNCGTSSQYMDGSLAMAKELISNHKIKHIYLEMYYGVATGSSYQDRTQLTSTYIISDYMQPSLRKISYILQASAKEHWINSFVPARRNWEKLFNIEYIKNLAVKKQDVSYKNYEWIRKDGQTEYYVDRGYVANENVVGDTYINKSAYNPIDMNAISDDWKNSLQSIIQLCKREDVEITLFIAPMPEWTIVGKGNYDAYHKFIKTIADESGVDFYDFNLVNSNYFSTRNFSYFKDEDHLNADGAETFSRIFCDYFMGKIPKEELFFESLEEKLANDRAIVYGIAGMETDDKNNVSKARIIANRVNGIEYKITAIPSDGGIRLLQDFEENTTIELPTDEHGTLCIEWRLKDAHNDKIEIIELEY